MASTSHASNAQQASKECPVCMEELVEPKLLLCGHNLCSACVEKVAEPTPKRARHSNSNSDNTPRQLKCPLCNSYTGVPGWGLKTNYGMRDAIEREKKLAEENAKLREILDQQINAVHLQCSSCRKLRDFDEMFVCMEPKCEKSGHGDEDASHYGPINYSTENSVGSKQYCSTCMLREHSRCAHAELSKVASVDQVRSALEELDNLVERIQKLSTRLYRQYSPYSMERYFRTVAIEKMGVIDRIRSSLANRGRIYLLTDFIDAQLATARRETQKIVQFYERVFPSMARELEKELTAKFREGVENFLPDVNNDQDQESMGPD